MLKSVDDKFIRLGYDLILGFSVILIPDILISFFGIKRPEPMIFVYISGLFLLVVGYYLLYAYFHDVTQFLFIGFGSCLVRFTFTLIVLLLWMTEGIDMAYILIACTDAITGLLIFLPILRNNRFTRKELWIKD